MNTTDLTAQEIAVLISYHAEQMAITLGQFKLIDAHLKTLQKADPDLVIQWPMDERLSMAITAFGVALENEPTDIQDALEEYL